MDAITEVKEQLAVATKQKAALDKEYEALVQQIQPLAYRQNQVVFEAGQQGAIAQVLTALLSRLEA